MRGCDEVVCLLNQTWHCGPYLHIYSTEKTSCQKPQHKCQQKGKFEIPIVCMTDITDGTAEKERSDRSSGGDLFFPSNLPQGSTGFAFERRLNEQTESSEPWRRIPFIHLCLCHTHVKTLLLTFHCHLLSLFFLKKPFRFRFCFLLQSVLY